MRRNNILSIIHYPSYIVHCTLYLALALTVSSCTDQFAEYEDNEPSWLGPNVYDYLEQRGDCNYFCQLIQDCGYYESLKRTGSNTLFFSPDSCFESFFRSADAVRKGYTSYDKLPQSMKYLMLRSCMVENSQLIERLSETDHGGTLFRRTTLMEVEDTIPVVSYAAMPHNVYFDRFKDTDIRMLMDASQWTLVQFFPDVMKALKITDDDMKYICGEGASTNQTYLFQSRIVNQDITCKNGYLHELDRICMVPDNMAGYIRTENRLSTFNHLMDRFCEPVLYRTTSDGEKIYELRYFNESAAHPHKTDIDGKISPGTLYFDPGWNLYQYGSSGAAGNHAYEGDMAAMFVPTNEAMAEYFSADPAAEGHDIYVSFGGDWDNVPDQIAADLLKNHQLSSFVNSTPSHFATLKDMAGYEMEISKDNIVGSYVARNGVVYLINKVLPPLDYRSVMGPVKVDQNLKIFNLAMGDSYCQFQYYLRSLKSTYNFFVTPDEYMMNYLDPLSAGYSGVRMNSNWDFRLNPNTNSIEAVIRNGVTGDSIGINTAGGISGALTSRLTDIMNQQTLVGEVTPGQEWYVTKGYAPIRLVWGGSRVVAVQGAGNATPVDVTEEYEKTNGTTRYIKGILRTSPYSVYALLRKHAGASASGSEDDKFKAFYDMCEYCGLFEKNPTTSSAAIDYRLSFLSQYHYSMYIPGNAGVAQAIADGVVPSITDIETCSLTAEEEAAGMDLQEKRDALRQRMIRFVRYHVQDYSVMINGEPRSEAEFLSNTLNDATHKFYPIYVDQDGSSIQLLDRYNYQRRRRGQSFEKVKVSGELNNLMARDLIVNSAATTAATGIETYSYSVMHLLEDGKYLRFE